MLTILILILLVGAAVFAVRSGRSSKAEAPVAGVGNDFGDWVSPMLVKELRQGTRARLFTGLFLTVHVTMILIAVMGLLSLESARDTSGSSAFFWLALTVPLALVIPLAGFTSVSNEMQANTLELVHLTRLSAWRIIVGKWLSLTAQGALLVASVLPYAVLRYFLGGINVAQELLLIFCLFYGGAVLTAATVAVSPFQSKLGRGLLIAGGLVSLQVGPMLMFRAPFGLSLGGWKIFTLVVMGGIFALMMFEIGAARIAPAAENHSARKRLLALAALVVGGLSDLLVPALVFASPVLVGALCEETPRLSRLYQPFARRGWAGRVAAYFLYPGWESGVLFVLLFAGVATCFLNGDGLFNTLERQLMWGAAIGALLVPAAVARLRKEGTGSALTVFWAIQCASLILTLVVSMADDLVKGSLNLVLSVLPTATFVLWLSNGSGSTTAAEFIPGTAGVSGAALLILFAKMRGWRSRMPQAAAPEVDPSHVVVG